MMEPLTEAADLPRSRSRESRTIRFWLLLYGIVLCALVTLVFAAVKPKPMMPSRAADVAAAIAVIDKGGPPLLASDIPYHSGISAKHLRPVGVTDDEGIYLYLPLISRVTGNRDPAELMKWLAVGCFAVLVLAYPLIFYELFGSVAVSAVAPLAALGGFGFAVRDDVYSILAWSALLGIPALVLADRWWVTRRRRRALSLLLAVALAGSFATSIRSNAGLPLLIGGVGIVLLSGTSWRGLRRFWLVPRWWMRPVVAIALVLAYLSISSFAFAGVRAYRNHVIHQPGFGAQWPTHHPLWHNAYIGLGYLPNPYGIEYHDAAAFDMVERTRPGTGYLTTKYNAILRHAYVHIARSDTSFVLRTWWSKARVVFGDGLPWIWFMLVAVPAAFFVRGRRRLMRVALLIALPVALLGAAAPIVTVPILNYELQWLAAPWALFILAAGSLWVAARDAVASESGAAQHRGNRFQVGTARRKLASSSAVRAGLVGAAVGFLLVPFARPGNLGVPAAIYLSQKPAIASANALGAPPLRAWRFDGALPRGWRNSGGAYLQPDMHGLYVRSPMTTNATQLSGPWVDLPAGSYAMLTQARSIVGGLQVSVRTSTGKQLGSTPYSWHQLDVAKATLELPFHLRRRGRVRAFLSSWSSVPNASSWILFRMKLSKEA